MELRFEYKYYVPLSKEIELYKILSPFVTIDKHALDRPNNTYTVRSIYFDTADLRFYRDKVEGLAYRKKVRLRGYNNVNASNPVFMEIKNKIQVPLYKTRAKTTYEDALESFENENLQQILNRITKNPSHANCFLYQILSYNLRPVVNVIYERLPFTEKIDTANKLRITFDKNLRSCAFPKINELYVEKNAKHSIPGYFILEVKFNKFYPYWMKSIVTAFQLKQESASKYVISMNTHQIDLKYNRYQILDKKFI
jgi:SPX domain protein involved in polyphosphate accumulation